MPRTRDFIVWEIKELTGEQGTWPEGVMSKLLHPPQLLLLGLMFDGTSCSILQEAPLAGGTGEGHLVHLLEAPTRCWTPCLWSRVQTEGRQPCILILALLLATWPWAGHWLALGLNFLISEMGLLHMTSRNCGSATSACETLSMVPLYRKETEAQRGPDQC